VGLETGLLLEARRRNLSESFMVERIQSGGRFKGLHEWTVFTGEKREPLIVADSINEGHPIESGFFTSGRGQFFWTAHTTYRGEGVHQRFFGNTLGLHRNELTSAYDLTRSAFERFSEGETSANVQFDPAHYDSVMVWVTRADSGSMEIHVYGKDSTRHYAQRVLLNGSGKPLKVALDVARLEGEVGYVDRIEFRFGALRVDIGALLFTKKSPSPRLPSRRDPVRAAA
jgi:hypothetical protein